MRRILGQIRNCALAVLIGCLSPFVIWTAAGVALYQFYRGKKASADVGRILAEMACSSNNDCPPGHICMNGRCIPQAM